MFDIVIGDHPITIHFPYTTLFRSVTILDNDSATVSITANDATASETGTNNGQFTVSLTKVIWRANVLSSVMTICTSTPTTCNKTLSWRVTIPAWSLSAEIVVSGIL